MACNGWTHYIYLFYLIQVKSCKQDKRIMHVNISERYRMDITRLASVGNKAGWSKTRISF